MGLIVWGRMRKSLTVAKSQHAFWTASSSVTFSDRALCLGLRNEFVDICTLHSDVVRELERDGGSSDNSYEEAHCGG